MLKNRETLDGSVKQKKITILGWAFKKDTNDSRESAAIYVADDLLEEGAELHVYDPMVSEKRMRQDLIALWELRNLSKSKIAAKLERCVVHSDNSHALENTFAIAILTEWDEFKFYDWEAITKKMIESAKIFDGRNIIKNSFSLKNKLVRLGS